MVDPTVISADRTISFGPFRLFVDRRLLLEGETAVRIGSRALEILIALLERPGKLVNKEELIARVWPSTYVADGNLKFQVAALRRALGDGRNDRRFVENSPGQGYRFVGELVVTDDAGSLGQVVPVSSHRHNLPRRMTQLIGRTELVASLAKQLSSCRLLTIVGPGGMGKTSVAVAVGERLIGAHADGVCFTDLSSLADPSLVHGAVAAAMGIEVNSEGSLESLTRALCDKRMLFVLDDCAHVVDAAAALTDAILRGAPGVRILATSREPLRVQGEHLHRLRPLESPPASAPLTAAEALRFSAVELFVEQAAASGGAFELRDGDAAVVGEICRKLDGIPLAIELAAARVEVLGVQGLAGRLDDRLQVLTQGRRTALARHQTLRAALDWSYALLTASEQMVFDRLAVFVGGFTLAAAAAVAGDPSLSSHEVVDLVLELASKSLIAADLDRAEPRFRLLDTTRCYALEKLAERGETESVARRHAEHYRDLFTTAANGTADADAISAADALEIDNFSAALTWAFGSGGDLSGEARDLLGAVYTQFTEGFETDDQRRAKYLLDDLLSLETRAPHSRRPAAAALRFA